MFDEIVSKLKANKKTIVFTEGEDARILEAATRLKKDGIMDVLLCGDPEKIKAAAVKGGFDLTGMAFADPNNYPEIDAMVSEMVALRKGKMTEDEVRTALKKSNYFGTMLVKMGKADCLLGGATYSTADTVRPALQLIKTKPGNKIVSSCFIMVRPAASGENEVLAMADCDLMTGRLDTAAVAVEQASPMLERSLPFRPRAIMRLVEMQARWDRGEAERLLSVARQYASPKYAALALAHLGRPEEAAQTAAGTRSDLLVAQLGAPADRTAARDHIAAALPADLRATFVASGRLVTPPPRTR